jgi:hypothetical protein
MFIASYGRTLVETLVSGRNDILCPLFLALTEKSSPTTQLCYNSVAIIIGPIQRRKSWPRSPWLLTPKSHYRSWSCKPLVLVLLRLFQGPSGAYDHVRAFISSFMLDQHMTITTEISTAAGQPSLSCIDYQLIVLFLSFPCVSCRETNVVWYEWCNQQNRTEYGPTNSTSEMEMEVKILLSSCAYSMCH